MQVLCLKGETTPLHNFLQLSKPAGGYKRSRGAMKRGPCCGKNSKLEKLRGTEFRFGAEINREVRVGASVYKSNGKFDADCGI